MTNLAQKTQGRIFIKLNQNACVPYTYGGCLSVSGFSASSGGATSVYCASPEKYNEFVVIGSFSGADSRPSLTLSGYLPINERSLLEKLYHAKCNFDFQVHYGECTNPSEFNSFKRAYLFKNATIDEYTLSDLVAKSPDDRGLIDEEITVTVDSFESYIIQKPQKVNSTYTPLAVTNINKSNACATNCLDACCYAILSCYNDFDADNCTPNRMELTYYCGGQSVSIWMDCLLNTGNVHLTSDGLYLYIIADYQYYKIAITEIEAFLSAQTNACDIASAVSAACPDENVLASVECFQNQNLYLYDIVLHNGIPYVIGLNHLLKFSETCVPTTVATYASSVLSLSANDDFVVVTTADGIVYVYADDILYTTYTLANAATSSQIINSTNILFGYDNGIYHVCGTECLNIPLGGCVNKIIKYNDNIIYVLVNYTTGSEILVSIDGGVTYSKMKIDSYDSSIFLNTTLLDLAVCHNDPLSFVATGVSNIIHCTSIPDCGDAGIILYSTIA